MTEEDKKLHILLSTDGNYIMPSGVMMKSVSINNSNIPMEFHVMIDDSVTQKQKEQLQKVLINLFMSNLVIKLFKKIKNQNYRLERMKNQN